MGWLILGLLIAIGLPWLLVFAGIALALWLTFAVIGLVWGVIGFVFGSPVVGLLLAVGLGIAIGRASAQRRLG